MKSVRPWVLLGSLLGSLLLASAVLGPTEPTCAPVASGQPGCLAAKDCEGLDHVMCVGSWQCVDATCTYQCGGGVDQDGDGAPAPDDCDDWNPTVHPGAPDVCDGADNDCDGLVDEACLACAADADCPPAWSCAEHVICLDCVWHRQCKVACQVGHSCVPPDPYPAPCQPDAATGAFACAAGETCQCLPPPDCPLCESCYMGCVPAPQACGGFQSGACADPNLTCQCRPDPDCLVCNHCVYECHPPDDGCRFDADCWFGSACDFSGTPDWCGMVMSPVLPVGCWGTCKPCQYDCPEPVCASGQIYDPCACACVPAY